MDIGNRHGGGFSGKKIPSLKVSGSSSPPVSGDWWVSHEREHSHSQSQQGQDCEVPTLGWLPYSHHLAVLHNFGARDLTIS